MTAAAIAVPIREFVVRSFNGQQVADGDDIFALGFANSLFAMQLVAFVEKQFDIEIDSDDLDIDNFRSVSAISSLVERKLAA
jgi:acyl carrier protein